MIEQVAGPAGSQATQPAQNNSGSTRNVAQPDSKTQAVDIAPISPRLRFDAVSGVVVTEFLNQGGGVQNQVPSAAVLNYLRMGLQADGTSQSDKSEGTKA